MAILVAGSLPPDKSNLRYGFFGHWPLDCACSGVAGAGMLNLFPLMAIPVLIYNVMAFGAGPQGALASLQSARFAIPMASGAMWVVTSGDVVMIIALLMLFAEMLKAPSEGRAAIIRQALLLAIFIICLIEFLLFSAFASSLFFLITVMVLLNMASGFIIAISAPRSEALMIDDDAE